MNIRSILSTIAIHLVVVSIAAAHLLLPELTDVVAKIGKPYCEVVAVVTNDANAAKRVQDILAQEPSDSVNARYARILLARIEHPDVFVDFANEIKKWRKGEKSPLNLRGGERPGLLFGRLRQFTMRGPENKYVEEYARDANGKIVFEPSEPSEGITTLRGMRAKRNTVEKYTDAEVETGIARNAAARQAVLEHFLKFFDEGDAYEQGEMIMLVDHLWGRSRNTRTSDLAVIDHVKDADVLIESVFLDESRPVAARMCAAFCLADDKQIKVKAFMLGVVTNTPVVDSEQQSESMVNQALAYLEASADANTLAVLKGQTNGPAWKRKNIERATHAIAGRLSATPKQ